MFSLLFCAALAGSSVPDVDSVPSVPSDLAPPRTHGQVATGLMVGGIALMGAGTASVVPLAQLGGEGAWLPIAATSAGVGLTGLGMTFAGVNYARIVDRHRDGTLSPDVRRATRGGLVAMFGAGVLGGGVSVAYAAREGGLISVPVYAVAGGMGLAGGSMMIAGGQSMVRYGGSLQRLTVEPVVSSTGSGLRLKGTW